MMSSDAAVGMMDAAYFIGRKELLQFFNDLLQLNLQKIEETASGAVACQLTDYVFPGSIPMSRVNWEAKSDYEYVQNYKLLQAAFTKHAVQRHVDVTKLIRGKYQDNLEFCQWLKAFFDQQGTYRDDYDPVAVRARGKGGKKINAAASKSNGSCRNRLVSSRTTRRPTTTTAAARTTSTATRKTASAAASSTLTLSNRQLKENKKSSSVTSSMSTAAVVADAQLLKKNADLTLKLEQLRTQLAEKEMEHLEVEKERDFYFEKLRSVEVLLQVHQESAGDADNVIERVFKVLYATVEDNVVVGDDGEFLINEEQQEETIEEEEDLLEEQLEEALVE